MIGLFLKKTGVITLISSMLVSTFLVTGEAPSVANIPVDLSKIRYLVPRLLMKEESGSEEVSGESYNRFNFPAARLVNLPTGFLRSFYSQVESEQLLTYEEYLKQDIVSYTVISSVRYNTTKDKHIYLTTLVLSRKAELLDHRPISANGRTVTSDGAESVKMVVLKQNIQAMLFSNPLTPMAINQLVFVQHDQNYMYYITVGSDLPADELIKLVSNHLEMQPAQPARALQIPKTNNHKNEQR